MRIAVHLLALLMVSMGIGGPTGNAVWVLLLHRAGPRLLDLSGHSWPRVRLYACTQVGVAAGWVAYCFTGAGVVS